MSADASVVARRPVSAGVNGSSAVKAPASGRPVSAALHRSSVSPMRCSLSKPEALSELPEPALRKASESSSSQDANSGRSSPCLIESCMEPAGVRPLRLSSAKRPSADLRKVSINDRPIIASAVKSSNNNNESNGHNGAAKLCGGFSTSNISEASSSSQTNVNGGGGTSNGTGGTLASNHRTSLLHIPAEKRARKVRFFINNDRFFKGVVIAVSTEKFRTFEKLLDHLTHIMCNQVTLPHGVRCIFALDGRTVEDVAEFSHEENYVCSSVAAFKKLDYVKLAQEQDQTQWNRIKRETYIFGPTNGTSRRDAYKQSGHSKSFGLNRAQQEQADAANSNGGAVAASALAHFKPKIIAVLRAGLRPRKAFRVLLNQRNAKSFDSLLAELTTLAKLDSGAVRKVFALSGKPVLAVADFIDDEVFMAYGGSDKCQPEDFDLDIIEFRGVQSILKSPDLDTKFAKFASAGNNACSSSSSSPKTNRRKFLSTRQPALSAKNRGKSRKQSSSKSRQSARESPPSSAASTTATGDGDSSYKAPKEVVAKYMVGDIIGDGNFAVVRRCFCKRTKREFALKVIDKSKCQGKEHMIESEVRILGLVAHASIIELVEVFDFPEEKYLVTELVRGGDLFDAIANDTKYSEPVSRGMVRDLACALKYLHDRMIVHRDIKPENLLVVELGPDPSSPEESRKTLKLADFGLAQVVSEPLFTVCGTPTYVAPEILAETGYGVKVDVWATGVIMYILLVGFPPFSSRTNNQDELFDQILSGLFEFNSPDWDEISYPAKELISWMLQVDPLQRYSAYEILEHPWIHKSS